MLGLRGLFLALIALGLAACATAKTAGERPAFSEDTGVVEADFSSPVRPSVTERDITFGPASAAVTVVMYSDPLCPYCRDAWPAMEHLRAKYGDKVRVVYKHTPFKDHADVMARYAQAIRLQDNAKAAEFVRLLLTEPLDGHGDTPPLATLDAHAQRVGADMARLSTDLDGQAVTQSLEADLAEFQKFGFGGTPSFVFNGVRTEGLLPTEAYENLVNRLLARR